MFIDVRVIAFFAAMGVFLISFLAFSDPNPLIYRGLL